MGSPELYPKTKSEGDEIDKIIEKLQDKWFGYDLARSRLAEGKAKGNEAADYAKYRKQIETDLKRMQTLFHF